MSVEDRPVCEECGAELSRDEVTETVSRRLQCRSCEGES